MIQAEIAHWEANPADSVPLSLKGLTPAQLVSDLKNQLEAYWQGEWPFDSSCKAVDGSLIEWWEGLCEPPLWSSLSGEHHVSPNPLLQYSFTHTASCNQVVFNSCKLNAQWAYQLDYHLVQLCLMRQSGCINISWYDTNWPVVWETQCEST